MLQLLKWTLLTICWLFAAGPAMATWPERPVTLVVGWPVGSGSDLLARALASGLEKVLGVPFAVLNIEGADGIFAHSMVAFGNPDGYTLGLVTPDFIGAYWQMQTDYSFEHFAPIARIEESPAVFWVRQDSPWLTLRDALTAIRKAPSHTYRIGGLAVGGAYHIAFAALLRSQGLSVNDLRIVVADGDASCFDRLGAGEVDICPGPPRDGHAAYHQGRVRPLAVFSRNRVSGWDDLPTVRQAVGKEVVGGTWRAVLAPPNLPAAIVVRLREAVIKVVHSAEFQNTERLDGFDTNDDLLTGDDLSKFMADEHFRWGDILREMNLRERK